MIHTLVVTLGKLGETLIESSEKIFGSANHVDCFCLDWEDDLETSRASLQKRIKQLDGNGGVLLLTDMLGCSSTNISLDFLEKDKVEVLTGVNLPMLIKATTLPANLGLAEAARRVRTQGQKSIYITSEML